MQCAKIRAAFMEQRCDVGGCAGSAQGFMGSGYSADFKGPLPYLIASLALLHGALPSACKRQFRSWLDCAGCGCMSCHSIAQGLTAVCRGCCRVAG